MTPQSRVKTKKGGHYEVQVTLARRDVINLILARRRLREYLDSGVLYSADEYLMAEFVISVLSGLIAQVDERIRHEGFTWNIESEGSEPPA